jgi:hypothetical protein
VLTDIDRIWTLAQPHVNAVLNERSILGWVPVYQSGSCLVLRSRTDLPDAKQ